MISSLITAVRTLTILPVPGKDANNPASSVPFFPLVGLLIGGICYGTALLTNNCFPEYTLLTGALVTLVATVVTGALHLDGLADVADGFGGGKDKEHILAIMKDPRHGTFGSATLSFSLLLKTVLISIIIHIHMEASLLIMPLFTRTYQAFGCSFFHYARSNEGTASPFITSNYRVVLIVLFVVQTVLTLYILKNITFLIMIASSSLTAGLFYCYCRSKISGITGDCIGAGSEIAELFFLFFAIPGFHFM